MILVSLRGVSRMIICAGVGVGASVCEVGSMV